MIEVAKVSTIATAMAIVGTLILPVVGGHSESLLGLLPKVILASNLFWVTASLILRHRAIPLGKALLLGAVSPFLGAIILGILFPSGFEPNAPWFGAYGLSVAETLYGGVMFYLLFVTATSWICVPVGIVTAFLIHRAQAREARLA